MKMEEHANLGQLKNVLQLEKLVLLQKVHDLKQSLQTDSSKHWEEYKYHKRKLGRHEKMLQQGESYRQKLVRREKEMETLKKEIDVKNEEFVKEVLQTWMMEWLANDSRQREIPRKPKKYFHKNVKMAIELSSIKLCGNDFKKLCETTL